MTQNKRSFLSRFRRNEDGHATIEFAIMVPFLFVIMLSAVELGMLTMRYAFLERGLDIVVRDIRLSTGAEFEHDEIRDQICDAAGMIPDCSNNLKLEMITLDLRDWTGIPTTTVCTNRAEEVQPLTSFQAGGENTLMVLRACAKIEPLFPTTGLGATFNVDSAGDYALVATSAFVQEPR
ncbi:TadE/TadG family type IV pilus assembly protein [Thiosulfatihalobacter marinus]|jgi:Flp pilus assembly pilin Flp|uniref:TadE/TadG family type IV pilus assembly protein n=1 Tax=Thiosulfatihalobacter marinus TaxID=2792481 RepID=UPI0018D5D9F6|nr:TadE/TadG family type IV pilus assembly protein [Thiosulfatihalobacter marinus]